MARERILAFHSKTKHWNAARKGRVSIHLILFGLVLVLVLLVGGQLVINTLNERDHHRAQLDLYRKTTYAAEALVTDLRYILTTLGNCPLKKLISYQPKAKEAVLELLVPTDNQVSAVDTRSQSLSKTLLVNSFIRIYEGDRVGFCNASELTFKRPIKTGVSKRFTGLSRLHFSDSLSFLDWSQPVTVAKVDRIKYKLENQGGRQVLLRQVDARDAKVIAADIVAFGLTFLNHDQTLSQFIDPEKEVAAVLVNFVINFNGKEMAVSYSVPNVRGSMMPPTITVQNQRTDSSDGEGVRLVTAN